MSATMASPRSTGAEIWELRLYIADRSPKCLLAITNLEEYLAGRYQIEVVDLQENPRRAADDQILAVPTLVRKLPEPVRKVVGDLSDTDRLLAGLQARKPSSGTAPTTIPKRNKVPVDPMARSPNRRRFPVNG
jgi:circadian clock protein KaiB